MGLFSNKKKNTQADFKHYASTIIGNDEDHQTNSMAPLHEQLDEQQRKEIIRSYAESQKAASAQNDQATASEVRDITDEAEEVNPQSNNAEHVDLPTNDNPTDVVSSPDEDETAQADYANNNSSNDVEEQPSESEEPTDYQEAETGQTTYEEQQSEEKHSNAGVDLYELEPSKLSVVDNVIEQNYVFDVDEAFVDWFTNDLPVTAGSNGADNLRNRKLIAMHQLTKTYLKIFVALTNENGAKKFEDLDIDKLNLSKGGFLTIYSSYIYNNIDYLLTAIRFYNGNINNVQHSNWHEINTSEYLQKLYSIAIHGSEYVHKNNYDYENAIVRMSKGVKTGNIILNRE